MVKNHHLAKSISDASWAKFIEYVSYKAESAGKKVIFVNPRNTSQICSSCGAIVKKSLSVRVHKCPSCGLILDRDVNAAINILRLGTSPRWSYGISRVTKPEAPTSKRSESGGSSQK
jgi:putative transposase